MDRKDFSRWEEEIKTKVEKSINSINFDKLGRDIEYTVNKTMEQAMREVKKAWGHRDYVEHRMDEFEKNMEEKIRQRVDRRRDAYTNRRTYRTSQRSYSPNQSQNWRENSYQYQRPRSSHPRVQSPSFPVARTPSGTVSGVLYEVFGGIGVGTFGLTFFIYFFASITSGIDIGLLGLFLTFTLLCGLVLWRGIIQRKRVRRFKRYVKIMDGKCHYPVEKLAAYMGQKKQFTVKDLNKMTDLGMFPEGHFDEAKTDFILDHKTYDLYLDTIISKKQREQEEERALREREVAATRVTEDEIDTDQDKVERVLAQGNIYIGKIRECNDKIPDDIVSEKLFKLEYITNRIFEHIKKYPNKVEKIEKFMDYYLPTTLKLVTTYQELDSQPVVGENIRRTKVEIEETLDTINAAFGKLLDSLFEDEMFDISSDISVLETVLKQEGLAESDFSMKNK